MAHVIQDEDDDNSNNNTAATSTQDWIQQAGNKILDLNFSSAAFLASVTESLQVIPSHAVDHLILRSSTGGTGDTIAGGEIVDLFRALGAFTFQTVKIDGFVFEIPVDALARLLQQSKSKLKNLYLMSFRLSGLDDDDAFSALCAAIKAVREPLGSACLIGCLGSNPSLWMNKFKQLLPVLASNTQSLELDIHPHSYDFHGNDPVGVLESMHAREFHFFRQTLPDTLVSPNTAMTEITVSICDGRSLLPIANALKQNNKLTNLQIKQSARMLGIVYSVPTDVAKAFHAMTRDNYVLQNISCLDISSTARPFAQRSDVNDVTMALYLKLNRAGRQFLLESGQSTRQDWLDTIISHRRDTRMVHYFLSKNPALCCGSA